MDIGGCLFFVRLRVVHESLAGSLALGARFSK